MWAGIFGSNNRNTCRQAVRGSAVMIISRRDETFTKTNVSKGGNGGS